MGVSPLEPLRYRRRSTMDVSFFIDVAEREHNCPRVLLFDSLPCEGLAMRRCDQVLISSETLTCISPRYADANSGCHMVLLYSSTLD